MKTVEALNKHVEKLRSSKFLMICILLMLVSYFYNLPVFNYSLKGSNELRLYDFVGALLFFSYYQNKRIVDLHLKRRLFLYRLKTFLIWGTVSLLFTGIFSLVMKRPLWVLQSGLYVYHFWIFFLAAVFLSILIEDRKKLKTFVTLLMILIIVESIVVLLQNFGLIPFLWNNTYKRAYLGFLSGTLGPNKIVLGMTMLMSFILSVAFFLDNRLKVNKLLLIGAIGASLLALAISGSRTSYLGLGVFFAYFFYKQTGKFLYLAGIMGVLLVIMMSYNPEIIDKIMLTFDNRIFNKISDPTVLSEGNVDVGQLYEDLGAGRKNLSLMYIEYLLSNPYIIPLGLGFNNRLIVESSAHNIYLSLINEVGILGLILYMRWMISYLYLSIKRSKYLKMALNGLVLSMMVTLFFGEHIYVYRPLFGLTGLFLFATTLLTSPRYFKDNETKVPRA